MRRRRKVQKSISILMALVLLMVSTPLGAVFAAMVGTEAILENRDIAGARDQVRSFFDRQDVQSVLTDRGIDPEVRRCHCLPPHVMASLARPRSWATTNCPSPLRRYPHKSRARAAGLHSGAMSRPKLVRRAAPANVPRAHTQPAVDATLQDTRR